MATAAGDAPDRPKCASHLASYLGDRTPGTGGQGTTPGRGVPEPRQRVVIIRNPVAGRAGGRDWEAILETLSRARVGVRVLDTSRPGQATELARGLVDEKPDVVAVAGGDGTLNEVVNGLANSGLPVAILPLGTANVFAREIGMPCNGRAAADAILYGARQTVHLGRSGDRYFVLMAGVGFDGEVVNGVSGRLKARFGKVAYVLSALQVILRQPQAALRIEADGELLAGAHAIISNAHFYGGPFSITPEAALDRPDFQICVFGRNTRFSLLRYAVGIACGRHMTFGDVVMRRARTVAVESDATVHVQIDGDPHGTLPTAFAVAENALTIVLPRPGRPT